MLDTVIGLSVCLTVYYELKVCETKLKGKMGISVSSVNIHDWPVFIFHKTLILLIILNILFIKKNIYFLQGYQERMRHLDNCSVFMFPSLLNHDLFILEKIHFRRTSLILSIASDEWKTKKALSYSLSLLFKGVISKSFFFREMTVDAVKIYKMEEVKKHNILKGANKVNT